MKVPFRFALFASLALLVGCDKESSDPTPPARPLDAAPVAKPTAGPSGPFQMIVTPEAALAPGTPASLTLELLDSAGKRVTALDTVHEKQIHLIVVSPDLSFFSHVHPEAQADGRLRVDVTVPHPATYVAFGDFRPTGSAQTVARATLVVPGETPAPKALEARALPARGSFDGFEVSLRSKAPLIGGGDAVLEFEIFEKAAPVSDLRNYLGARGHCVIVSEDTTGYLHSHPLGGTGSKVQFHTTLPNAGTYKVWAEFRPLGKPVVASFVVDVPAEAAPPEEPHEHGGDQGHSH